MGRVFRNLLVFGGGILLIIGVLLYGVGAGWYGVQRGAGDVLEKVIPASVVKARERFQARSGAEAGAETRAKQILFGDFHVHTTFSTDAFLISLPVLQGEGAHPPADACDFARFCSSLDFWSINDHAERMTPHQWEETRRSIRQCNMAAGSENDPDLVSFLGWEWTQIGPTRDTHYGHKNVVLRDIEEDKTPLRPISAAATGPLTDSIPFMARLALGVTAPGGGRQEYLDMARFITDRIALEKCPDDVHVRDLPPDCTEAAATPAILYRKLREWGHEAIVIPHGGAWGLYTPPGYSFDKQLSDAQNDPTLQTLVEVFSGHGNSEVYRDWRSVGLDKDGKPFCPQPSADYIPACWQGGEIIRTRCLEEGGSARSCEARAREAQQYYVEAPSVTGFLAVAGTFTEDWLDAGQCRDCYLPSFNYRPRGSAQYILALGNFDDPDNPKYFNMGFIGSSDIHRARPGTGYKEFGRIPMTEIVRASKGSPFDPLANPEPPSSTPRVVDDALLSNFAGFQRTEVGRAASFFTTGGLVAVHSEGRNRGAIWDALKRREVYSTSGDRILLWFDLENAPEGKLPMGSETQMQRTPRFTVRAVGAFEQKPGCPDFAEEALGAERLQSLCVGECYNPSDKRHRITHIDIIRIHPQIAKGEPMENLIEDPWKRFPCPLDEEACVVNFSDPDFRNTGRRTVYYARAVQEPSPVVNGNQLRCSYDSDGNCVKVNPCHGDYRTAADDSCLGEVGERAWSSPIYINYKRNLRAARP